MGYFGIWATKILKMSLTQAKFSLEAQKQREKKIIIKNKIKSSGSLENHGIGKEKKYPKIFSLFCPGTPAHRKRKTFHVEDWQVRYSKHTILMWKLGKPWQRNTPQQSPSWMAKNQLKSNAAVRPDSTFTATISRDSFRRINCFCVWTSRQHLMR